MNSLLFVSLGLFVAALVAGATFAVVETIQIRRVARSLQEEFRHTTGQRG